MFYFLQSPLSPSLRAKRSNPVLPLPSLRAKRGNPVPRASNLGGRFTLPITPGIKFGGHFHLPDSSEVKFGGHSCIIDLSDTLIWGSFFYHRPARHPNLGVKLPVPRKLHTPLLPKPTSQSESPHLFFAAPRGDHRESSTKRSGGQEELARSA